MKNNNYIYDEIGNWVGDKKEGILEIEWSMSNKVKKIRKQMGVNNFMEISRFIL